ncbi:hypothetical protein IFM89_035047 [Coptis chinensis]|uniref:Uncharacterized protein n=1 Tax=Coptis chinensis TaxID=261450 RepID=A0A835H7U8_9MAGN|nr:hypothetical protein IFM89_035047 [Coptis chinensis]
MEQNKQHEMCSGTSDPLFSIFITSYTLILLYFPQFFLTLIFSPIVLSTSLLLSTLIHFGTYPTPQDEEILPPSTTTFEWVTSKPETETGYDPKPHYPVWNMSAPLEVIHEEYEGEGENQEMGNVELVSISLCFPESDTESSSDGEFPAFEGWDEVDYENMCLRWDEVDYENYKDGLIEIKLDGIGKRRFDFQVDEENLIEIDIGVSVCM